MRCPVLSILASVANEAKQNPLPTPPDLVLKQQTKLHKLDLPGPAVVYHPTPKKTGLLLA